MGNRERVSAKSDNTRKLYVVLIRARDLWDESEVSAQYLIKASGVAQGLFCDSISASHRWTPFFLAPALNLIHNVQ